MTKTDRNDSQLVNLDNQAYSDMKGTIRMWTRIYIVLKVKIWDGKFQNNIDPREDSNSLYDMMNAFV